MTREELFEVAVVRTASPCSAEWSEMVGDDVTRHCNSCKLFVHDLSKLTTAEALALLGTPDRVCARVYTRADGTVLTRDCPTGLRRARRKWVGAFAAVVSLGIAGLSMLLNPEPNGWICSLSKWAANVKAPAPTPVIRSENPPGMLTGMPVHHFDNQNP